MVVAIAVDYARITTSSQERRMSKPIIVGYDPATSDRAPVNFGVAAARFTGAPLIVASVGAALDGQDAGQQHEDLVPDATQARDEAERELEPEGISVECRALTGTSAARALHETSEAEDAGLLVVGSTRRGAVGRLVPGSTAERLMHGAPCPIAIVPPGWERGAGLNTIGVAYVDTEEGREALRSAHALARRAGASLRALTAVKAGLAMYGETEAGTPGRRGKEFEEVEGELRVRAEAALRRATDALGDDVPVETDAFVEDPADALIGVSEHLDLLVCGSRGYGPLRAVLLGGVSRRLTAEARCPVLVIPRAVTGSLEALMEASPGAAAR
jgi:nucleotide-binding universal stress UspA family protein